MNDHIWYASINAFNNRGTWTQNAIAILNFKKGITPCNKSGASHLP
jgi:hypothetical protein